MPLRRLLFALACLLPAGAQAQTAEQEAEMIAAFNQVVFSAEIAGPFSDTTYLKRFEGPVRFRLEQSARIDRETAVRGFVARVEAAVDGLETIFVGPGEPADFVVHVVDRAQYQEVGRQVYDDPGMRVPGNCIVRASYGRRGIERSDAIIVSDEGEARFQRCLVEEILQGLGPLNDSADLPDSVFNDHSRLIEFGAFDRLIMNMLYDARLSPGMRAADAAPLLPQVLADAWARLPERTRP